MKPSDEHLSNWDQPDNRPNKAAEIAIERLDDPAVLFDEKAVWDDWCEKAAHPSIFCTADWLATWWETYGTIAKPLILRVIEGENTTIGYAPLMRITRKPLLGLSLRSIEFIGTGERVCPEYLDVVAAPNKHDSVRHAVCNYLAGIQNEWDRLWLTDGLSENSLARVATDWSWPGHSSELIWGSTCPYVDLGSSWDDFLAARTAHMRRKIRQIGHRIERELDVDWKVFQPGDNPAEAIATMTDLHTRARKLKGETGNFIYDQYRRFHEAMIIRTASNGRLYLAFLEVNKQPASFFYGFLFGKCLFNYQTGFNPEFSHHRPGWYALARMIQDLIPRGCMRVDFLRGDHDYKWHWADNWHETVNGAVFSPRVAGRLGGLAAGLAVKVRARRNQQPSPPEFVLRRRQSEREDEQ